MLTKITHERYYELLGAVPPELYGNCAFLVGEPQRFDPRRGQLWTACWYMEDSGNYYAEEMTRAEFIARFCDDTPDN